MALRACLILLCLIITGAACQPLRHKPIQTSYVFVPTPDSTHVRDMSEIAKATSMLLSAKGFDNASEHVFVATLEYISSMAQRIAKEGDNEPLFTVLSHPHPNIQISEAISRFANFTKSQTRKEERIDLSLRILNVPYQLTLEMMTFVVERMGRVLFVIDFTSAAAIDFAEHHGYDFVIVNVLPTIIFNKNIPQYLSRYPFTSSSLRSNRQVLNTLGTLHYLWHRFHEEVILFARLAKDMFGIVSELNAKRKANGLPQKYNVFYESTHRVFIHFALPGFFDNSFPIDHNHFFVGYKQASKVNHLGKSTLFQRGSTSVDNLSDEEMTTWLSKQQQVALIAFGTKVEIAPVHMTQILKSLIETNMSVVCIYSHPETLGLKALPPQVLFQTWVNQPLVLSHASTKVFVSHGGANSVVESIEAEIPLIVFPIFGDQFGNAVRVEDAGIGLSVSEEMDGEQISTITHHVKYILEHQFEMKSRMQVMKRANQRLSQLSIQSVMQLGCEKLSQFLERTGSNVLAASDLIIQVGQEGSDNFISDTSHKLTWIEKINMHHVAILLIITTIIAIYISFRKVISHRKVL